MRPPKARRGSGNDSISSIEGDLDKFFSLSHDLLCIADKNGCFARLNGAWERVLGYSLEELTGQPFLNFVHPDDREKTRQESSKLAHGTHETVSFENRYLHRDGSVRWLLWNAVWGGDRIYAVARDITEMKREQAALNERLVRAVTVGDIGFWELDPETNVVYFSPQWKKQLGYTDDEFPNHIDEWLRRIHSGDMKRWRDAVRRAAKGTRVELEYRVRHKDGDFRHILSQGKPVKDEDHRTRILGTHMDVTERVEMRSQLQHAQRMESLGQLAAGIAHDFNNLLTIINNTAELARSRLERGHPLAGDLDSILDAGSRGGSLTKQILAFGRKQVLEPRVVDLNTVVSTLEPMLRRAIGDNINLVLTTREGVHNVLLDPRQIEQVLINLAVNARDAMPGGGALTIETANIDLDDAYTRRHVGSLTGPHVVLTVTDTGIGMDSATKERIFDPFFTTKGSTGGTGLGLSTVYGIVKQSGGSIWVYSEKGRGTVFKIYFPKSSGDKSRVKSPRAVTAGGNETILVVEDEPSIRELAERILQVGGYQLLAAADGLEALKILDRNDRIDLIITDVMMPNMSGIELIKLAKKRVRDVKALFTSGYSSELFSHSELNEDEVQFIQKPYSIADLRRKVREVLDARK